MRCVWVLRFKCLSCCCRDDIACRRGRRRKKQKREEDESLFRSSSLAWCALRREEGRKGKKPNWGSIRRGKLCSRKGMKKWREGRGRLEGLGTGFLVKIFLNLACLKGKRNIVYRWRCDTILCKINIHWHWINILCNHLSIISSNFRNLSQDSSDLSF